MCNETFFFPVWLDFLNECQLTTSTLSIKSLHEQGNFIATVLQKRFLVQWRNFHDFPTTIFCSENLTEGFTVVVYKVFQWKLLHKLYLEHIIFWNDRLFSGHVLSKVEKSQPYSKYDRKIIGHLKK